MPTTYRSCNLCEASCGLEIETAADRVIAIRGDALDPFSKGYVCPKGIALQDLQHDPDRLTRPVRRMPDGSWQEMGWEEALDLVAARLLAARAEHGPDAVGFYLGNPITHGWAPVTIVPLLLKALGTRSRYSAASVDQQPQHLLSYLLFGSPLLLPVPDIDRTDHLMVIGGNPVVSNGSIMTAPDVRRRLSELRRRGGRLVVVDPRRTETARLADQHVFVRPGSDVFLLAAMVHVILGEGLARPGRAAAYVDGIESIAGMVEPFSPEAVAGVTGVAADEIRGLARDLATAERAAVYARVGVCQSEFGTAAYWLVHVLNVITGRLDEVGGWMLATPAFDLPVLGERSGLVGYDRWRSRVRGIPEFAAEFPVATLADEILTPGAGRIRALVLYAGNPVLSAPDGRRMDRALDDLDFLVAVDYYVTESTRHADVILPPQTPLERDEFDVVFPAVSVRNWVRWNPRAIDPPADTRSDAQILLALLRRVETSTVGRRRAAARHSVLSWAFPRRLVDIALRAGPYGVRARGPLRGLSLATVQRHPHGLDLGPLQPCLPGRLLTGSKRIDLAHPVVRADWPRVAAALGGAARGSESDGVPGLDLLLIGRRHLRSNNSWMHNSPRLTRGRDRSALMIHPDDASARGIVDGGRVSLRSSVGSIELAAEVTDDVMRGVVCAPHGWGHGQREGVGWRHAAGLPGASVNDVTDSARIDPVSGNAAVQAVPVAVEPVGT